MSKTSLRSIWWTATVIYILALYLSLPFVPKIWEGLNSFFKGRIIPFLYTIYFLVGSGIFIYILSAKKGPLNYFLYFMQVGVFFMILNFLKIPAEKIHLAEYSILAILLYNSLKFDFLRFDKRLYQCSVFFCFSVGTIDEIIQAFLPNRYFDWRDIFINTLSGIISLSIIRFNILRKKDNSLWIFCKIPIFKKG